jgi:lipopolysaccharide transport system permease protein
VQEALVPGPVRPAVATSVRRIQPSHGFVPIDVAEIVRYRHLLFQLVWRDIRARYKQTFLGPSWAIIRPLLSMVLMAAIFGGLAGFTSGQPSIPYPLFLYSGMLIWTYFQSALPAVAQSLLNNASLLGKIYFPRLFAPFAQATAPLVDFGLAFLVVFGLFGYYGIAPSWHIVFLPFFILLAFAASLGIGLWLCGIAVRFRDVPFALPYIIQLWFFATPVIYPIKRLPQPYQSLIALNPMTSVIDGFRWSLLGISSPNVPVLAVSSVVVLVLFVGGLFVFRRAERTIVDMF